MVQSIATIAFLVCDYDEAIAWFTAVLGFELMEDTPLDEGKRWVIVSPKGGPRLLLAEAATPAQMARVGDQTGGRVFLFLETDGFERDYGAMRRRGVTFLEDPRIEPDGTGAVFEDLYGNGWNLIEPRGRG